MISLSSARCPFSVHLFTVVGLIFFAHHANGQPFSMPAGGDRLVVSTCDGHVLDPGGSGNYTLGQRGSLVVYPNSPGVVVEIELEQLNIDPGDSLTLSVGSQRGTILANNSNLPMSIGDVFVGSAANSGALHFEFVASSGDGLAGFSFRVRCTTADHITIGDPRYHDFQGKFLVDSGGFSGPYGANENLTTRLQSLGLIVLGFDQVDIESCCDKVELFNQQGSSLGVVPGPDAAFQARQRIDVTFTSDGSIQQGGWIADPTLYNSMFNTGSSSSVHGNDTFFTHPGGALDPYQPNQNVQSGVASPHGDLDLVLDLFAPNLGTGDSLKVYGGVNASAPLLATVQQTSSPVILSQPGSKHMYLDFQSDGSDEGEFTGSFFSMAIMHQDRTATVCDRVFSDSGGLSGTYGNSEDVTLVLRPDNPAASMSIDFSTFDIESGFDLLTIYDGDSTSAPVLAEFTGNQLPPFVSATPTPGAALTLRFTSDSNVVNDGFSGVARCRLTLFEDGFESGNLDAWSAAVP